MKGGGSWIREIVFKKKYSMLYFVLSFMLDKSDGCESKVDTAFFYWIGVLCEWLRRRWLVDRSVV